MNINDTIIINPVNTSGGGEILNDVVIPSTYSASTLSPSSSFNVLIDGDYELIPKVNSLRPVMSSMYYYARDHIPSYSTISYYPNVIQYNPDTSNVINFSFAFYGMKGCMSNISSIISRFNWNRCNDMSYAFSECSNLTGFISEIPRNVTNLYHTFYGCSNITGVSNIPNRVTNMAYAFADCSKISSDVYIDSNYVTNAYGCFYNIGTLITIYVHSGTTYNSFYKAMGNNTYNSKWKCYLKTF